MKSRFAAFSGVLALAAAVALVACNHNQKMVGGAAAGGVAGALVAGPVGAAVGAGAGAVTAPVIAGD